MSSGRHERTNLRSAGTSPSMRVCFNSWAGGANEKVEVSAFVGLIDMIDVELGVPARRVGRTGRPLRHAGSQAPHRREGRTSVFREH